MSNVFISLVLVIALGVRLVFGDSHTKRGLTVNCIQNGIFLGAGVGLIVKDAIGGNLVWCIVDALFAVMFAYYTYYYYNEWKKVN